MTPARLEEIQNRIDKGVASLLEASDLMSEVRRLTQENRELLKKNQELENDVTDLSVDADIVNSAISAWEDKFEHAQSSALTASQIAAELREENNKLREESDKLRALLEGR